MTKDEIVENQLVIARFLFNLEADYGPTMVYGGERLENVIDSFVTSSPLKLSRYKWKEIVCGK